MASGYHGFTAGEKPTASTMNDYLSKQVVMVFADDATRNTDLTSVLREGMVQWSNDSNSLRVYNGSNWITIYQPATSWSVTWSNLTLGNGTLAAIYARSGPDAILECRITFGSTTSVSGNIGFTLPVDSISGVRDQQAPARFFDASASTNYPGVVRVTGTTTAQIDSIGEVTNVNTIAGTSSTVPFTWTTNDAIGFRLMYTAIAS